MALIAQTRMTAEAGAGELCLKTADDGGAVFTCDGNSPLQLDCLELAEAILKLQMKTDFKLELKTSTEMYNAFDVDVVTEIFSSTADIVKLLIPVAQKVFGVCNDFIEILSTEHVDLAEFLADRWTTPEHLAAIVLALIKVNKASTEIIDLLETSSEKLIPAEALQLFSIEEILACSAETGLKKQTLSRKL